MSTDRYAGYLGDGLHLLDTADGDLGYPEGAGDVGPLLACPRALHSSALGKEKMLQNILWLITARLDHQSGLGDIVGQLISPGRGSQPATPAQLALFEWSRSRNLKAEPAPESFKKGTHLKQNSYKKNRFLFRCNILQV